MSRPLKMSYSRAKAYLGFCPYSNKLKYVDGHEQIIGEPSKYGSHVHEYISCMYRGVDYELPEGDRYKCFLGIDPDDYMVGNPVLVEGQNPLLWEDNREAGYLRGTHEGFDVVGVPDVVSQPLSDTLVIVDYKTGKMRLKPEEIATDAQMTLYRWLLEQNGWLAKSWIYNHCYISQSGKSVRWSSCLVNEQVYRGSISLVLRQLKFVYDQETASRYPPVAGFDSQTCRICGYREVCQFSAN